MGRKANSATIPAIYAVIGARIRDIREGLGLTQFDLADKANVSRPGVGMIETGRQRAQIDDLYGIAAALDVSIYALLPETIDEFEKPIAELFKDFLLQHLKGAKTD